MGVSEIASNGTQALVTILLGSTVTLVLIFAICEGLLLTFTKREGVLLNETTPEGIKKRRSYGIKLLLASVLLVVATQVVVHYALEATNSKELKSEFTNYTKTIPTKEYVIKGIETNKKGVNTVTYYKDNNNKAVEKLRTYSPITYSDSVEKGKVSFKEYTKDFLGYSGGNNIFKGGFFASRTGINDIVIVVPVKGGGKE